MKKIFLLALAVVMSAAFCPADAAKKSKKNKKKNKKEVLAPVQITTSSDSLSYAAGMALTNGLMPYLTQTLNVDTAYMEDFIRGFNDIVNNGEDPKMNAYAAGMSVANQLKGQMLQNMTSEFTDTPDSIIKPLVYRGFADALSNDTAVMKHENAEKLFMDKRTSNRAAKQEKVFGANRDAEIGRAHV